MISHLNSNTRSTLPALSKWILREKALTLSQKRTKTRKVHYLNTIEKTAKPMSTYRWIQSKALQNQKILRSIQEGIPKYIIHSLIKTILIIQIIFMDKLNIGEIVNRKEILIKFSYQLEALVSWTSQRSIAKITAVRILKIKLMNTQKLKR